MFKSIPGKENIKVGTYAICKSCNELGWLTRYAKTQYVLTKTLLFKSINKTDN